MLNYFHQKGILLHFHKVQYDNPVPKVASQIANIHSDNLEVSARWSSTCPFCTEASDNRFTGGRATGVESPTVHPR